MQFGQDILIEVQTMNIRRKDWTDYIVSREYVWRLLYTRNQVFRSEVQEAMPKSLHAFLQQLSSRTDKALLLRLFYLSQPEIALFFKNSLEDLVRSASRSTVVRQNIERGIIHGKVNWSKTLISRLSNRLDENSFITNQPLSSFDIPENRLLKLFLTTISESVKGVRRKLGRGEIEKELTILEKRADEFLKQAWIQPVQIEPKVTPLMRDRAHRSRNNLYSIVEQFQSESEELFMENKAATIIRLLRHGWLEPIDDNDLFEVYVLVRVLESLKGDLSFGEPQKVSLIKKDRNEIAHFNRSDGFCADVYYDQSPISILGVSSEYINVVKRYSNIVGSAHRPDIIVRLHVPDGYDKHILVECKKTDSNDYQSVSIYKGFGYLQDFSEIWEKVPSQKPKVIVVFPGDVGDTSEIGQEQNDLEGVFEVVD